MNPEERAICVVMAALLRRGRLIHGLSLPVTLLALVAAPLVALELDIRLGSAVLVATVIAGFCEAVLAARVAFDADLFERLGAGDLDLPTLDAALARLRLAPAAKLGRPLDARLAGARRLLALQLTALLLQLILVMAWLVLFRLSGGQI
ncbi:hypothetical protein SAMN05519104_2564 [Rhizobiales bacterium GAS188]|nr:hypothetical protein SAMN05519104_2564 [Rhizobiales bacterium GAS188]